MKKKAGSLTVLIFIIATAGAFISARTQEYDTVKSVVIGKQKWMTVNLNVSKFRNGDIIPEAKTKEEWIKAREEGKPAWCYYNNDPANGEIYGKLYNWYAVNDPRGLAPKGWLIPSDDKWIQLETALGMSPDVANYGYERGTDQGAKLKTTSRWVENGNGTNLSGFSALPGGYRDRHGYFEEIGRCAYFWTSSEYDYKPMYRRLDHDNSKVYRNSTNHREFGTSVRCIKDSVEYGYLEIKDCNNMFVQNIDFDNYSLSNDLIIYNSSTEKLITISSLTNYTDHFTIHRSSAILPPMDTIHLKLSFKPGGIGEYQDTIYIKSNDRNNTQTLISLYGKFLDTGSMVDNRDNRIYKSIKIADQEWMAENLDVAEFRNGDSIPEAKTNEEWFTMGLNRKPAWCFYDNDPMYRNKYGKLYNWHTVNDSRGLCPEGWHIPFDDEWRKLEITLGMSRDDAQGEDMRGTNEGNKLKSNKGWESKGNGTNSSGFSALPAGSRSYDGSFEDKGITAFFWSSARRKDKALWFRALIYNSSEVARGNTVSEFGFSVRCVKD